MQPILLGGNIDVISQSFLSTSYTTIVGNVCSKYPQSDWMQHFAYLFQCSVIFQLSWAYLSSDIV